MHYAYRNPIIRSVATIIDAIGRLFFHTKKLPDPAKIKKILVIKLDQLGDCLLMLPLFEHLAILFPNATIDVLCLPLSMELFQTNPHISRVIVLEKKLKIERYDLAIDPRGLARAARIAYKSGTPYRVGFCNEEWGGFLYTTRPTYDRTKHETEKYYHLFKVLGKEINQWNPSIVLTQSDKDRCDHFATEFSKPIIAIAFGAGVAYKRWPIDRFQIILETLAKNDSYQIALLGGPQDRELGESLSYKLPNIRNLAGILSVRESYVFLSHVAIFLGNDSFLAHCAGCQNIQMIELFNGANPVSRWKALGLHTYVVVGFDKMHNCRYDAEQYPCPHMCTISTKSVYEIISQQIFSAHK